ncbi:MAG: hypothetical protein PQJ49_11245, partial [Sphaerochaetaceae bacterium]|nr:hypothetical protein [Sphaerochaetaceae bacterium]
MKKDNTAINEKDFFELFFSILDDCYYIYLNADRKKNKIVLEIKNIDLETYINRISTYDESFFNDSTNAKKQELLY